MTEIPSTPSSLAEARGISEILHFTTNLGLLGILATHEIVSRDRLDDSETLDSIRYPNCANRWKDAEWTDYVSLSISRVNKWMLDKSKDWHDHDGVWWAVLALNVSLLDHTGVYFATTNNTYPVVRRATGVAGFNDLFSASVPWGYYGYSSTRNGRASWETTNPQAEVLYPAKIGISHLCKIYVPLPEHLDEVAGMIGGIGDGFTVPVECNPQVFS